MRVSRKKPLAQQKREPQNTPHAPDSGSADPEREVPGPKQDGQNFSWGGLQSRHDSHLKALSLEALVCFVSCHIHTIIKITAPENMVHGFPHYSNRAVVSVVLTRRLALFGNPFCLRTLS